MTEEEKLKFAQTVEYMGHWYDVIGLDKVEIMEKAVTYIEQLEKENKKLRCCENCKHFDIIWGSPKCIINDNGTVMKLNCTCKKWELDE